MIALHVLLPAAIFVGLSFVLTGWERLLLLPLGLLLVERIALGGRLSRREISTLLKTRRQR